MGPALHATDCNSNLSRSKRSARIKYSFVEMVRKRQVTKFRTFAFLSLALFIAYPWRRVQSKQLSGCSSGKHTVTFMEIGKLGRLGNQIFQVAATIGIARANDARWVFPSSISDSAVGKLFELQGRSQLELVPQLELREGSQLYHNITARFSLCTVSLFGYFQSLHYFKDVHEELRALLKIPQSLKQLVHTAVPEVSSEQSVAIHVRRGDYTQPRFEPLYNVLNESYYKFAVSLIPQVEQVIIVTDDVKWCVKHLSPLLDTKIIYSPFGGDEVLDFVLLHSVKRMILSCSSYSWWAAFLRDLHRLPHEIYAPATWYKPTGDLAYLNHVGFYPKAWTLLPN